MKQIKRPRKGALLMAAQGFEQLSELMALTGIESFRFDGLSLYFRVQDHDKELEVMPFGYTTDKITPELLKASAKAAETAAAYAKD